MFEYWGHEASLLPVELQPLLRWRMARRRRTRGASMRRMAREQPDLVAEVLEQVRERGPLAASELESAEARRRRAGLVGLVRRKRAIEYLFWTGQVTAARRRGFERLYDLPERVLPPAMLARRPRAPPTPSAR